jgi:hypothetical protein
VERPGYVLDRRSPLVPGHPLNAGLVLCLSAHRLFRGGQTWYDARRKTNGALVNGPAWASGGGPGGYGGLTYAASNQEVNFGAPATGGLAGLAGLAGLTVSAWVRVNTLREYGGVLSRYDNNNTRWEMLEAGSFDGGSDDVACAVSDGGSSYGYTTGGILAAGAWNHWCMAFDGSGAANADRIKFYFNGLPQTLSFAGTIPAAVPTVTAALKGCQGAGGFGWLDATVDDIRLYSRALPAAQVVALLDQSRRGHPDTFRWVSTRAWSVPAGGAASYTLTAAAGSYTLTGQPAALTAARRLAAAQGSYALTGQSANLLYGRNLAAGAGTYALTGQAAALRAARLLGAAQGSYTLTGQAAGLLLGHRLAAGQGSYTLTGQAAGLLYGRRLGAAQGSYALSGQDATLAYSASGNKVLAAAQGSYTLSGQAANLLYGRRLAAAQGSYALSGQAAGLYRGLRLAAAQGSYALTGQQVALRATRLLGASQGTYTLTGQAAALLRGYRVVGGLGTYALAGQDAALSRTRSLLALPGAYALTGRDATLSRSGTELPPTFRAANVVGRSGIPDVVGAGRGRSDG